jgi:hypothetical protein
VRDSDVARVRIDRVTMLLFASETRGDFAHQLSLFLPPRFQCPRENLLKMIAVVHGGVKENNVGAFFGSREFVLQGWMTIDCQRNLTRSSFSATCGHGSVDGVFQE